MHHSLCSDPNKYDSWNVALAFWEQAVSFPKLPTSFRRGVFPLCFVFLFSYFHINVCFLRFDRIFLLNTTIIALKTWCPAIASGADGFWRNQLCLEGEKTASQEEGGKCFRRNRVCFTLKYQGHQHGEQGGAVILLSAGMGAGVVTTQPFPFPSPVPWEVSSISLSRRHHFRQLCWRTKAAPLRAAGVVLAACGTVPSTTTAQIKARNQSTD